MRLAAVQVLAILTVGRASPPSLSGLRWPVKRDRNIGAASPAAIDRGFGRAGESMSGAGTGDAGT
jgi:hypothetical protein